MAAASTIRVSPAGARIFNAGTFGWSDGLAPAVISLGVTSGSFDRFNENVLAAGARLLGRGFWKIGDVALIDGLLVNGSAKLVGMIGSVVRLFQTGYLYHYALVMILGVFALMTWFVFMHP